MNLERFLNHPVRLSDVYLYKEPNKSGDKANVFYFCLYDSKSDAYLFLNDHKLFSGESVREILPPEDQLKCMWYGCDEEASREMQLHPEDFEEGDDFYWEIFETQKLEHLVYCDEFEGDLPESAKNQLLTLSIGAKYPIYILLEDEKRFVDEQIKYQQQKFGKSGGRQTTLFDFERE